MTNCTGCYWEEHCEGLTIPMECSDYTPLAEDQSAEEAYLATVRADLHTYVKTIPDFL